MDDTKEGNGSRAHIIVETIQFLKPFIMLQKDQMKS